MDDGRNFAQTSGIPIKNTEDIRNVNEDINDTLAEQTSFSSRAKNLEDIKQKCELYLFKESQKNIIENTLDLMFYSNNLKIGQAVLPQEIVRSRMQLLNASIIFYAFDKLNYLKQDSQIHNSTNFMISCLYNAITEYYSDSDLQFKIDYGSG